MSQPAYNPAMGAPQEEKNFGAPPYSEPPPPYPGNVQGQQGAYPPMPQQHVAYPPPQQPNYGQQPMMTAAPMTTTTTVVMTGNCPRCHMGSMIEEQNVCALVCIILAAILLFPIGLLCLLCLPGAVNRRCPSCGYTQ